MSDKKTEFIEHELMYLWDNLWWAERSSLSSDPQVPSMGMEGIMDRIKLATDLVGPVSWENISIEEICSGRYECWAKHMGIEYSMPPEAELAELKEKRRMWYEHLRGPGSSV